MDSFHVMVIQVIVALSKQLNEADTRDACFFLSCHSINNSPFLFVTGQVTDAMLMHASFVYPENTPTTKEAYYYRAIFEKFFPKVSHLLSSHLLQCHLTKFDHCFLT